jgi:hypothetical protein
MAKKGHWRIVGYDGAGSPIRARIGARVERERLVREDAPHRTALLRTMSRNAEHKAQDRRIRDVLGVNVR